MKFSNLSTQPHSHIATQPYSHIATQLHSHRATEPHSYIATKESTKGGRPKAAPTLWLCSYVAMWLCGYVAMELCGYMAMWLCGYQSFKSSNLPKIEKSISSFLIDMKFISKLLEKFRRQNLCQEIPRLRLFMIFKNSSFLISKNQEF